MLVELRSMGVSLETVESSTLVATFHVRPVLVDGVRDLQAQDPYVMKLRSKIEAGQQSNFTLRSDGTLVLGQRLCVPDVKELKKETMEEAHSSAYAMHPGSTKMYRTLKDHYWWRGMKREIAEFVSKCLTCQQIKIEHQKPAGLLQPLSIPEWKWERITMDFVTGLPKTQRGHDAIWVIMDRLTKSAHFIATNNTYSLERYARLYVDEIVRLHGAPVSIVSDRDPRFTSRFWQKLQDAMGTKLHFNTAFHPQTDGQSERTIKTL